MSGIIQDLRYAARGLMKNPGFSIVAVLTLALGIGAMTALFSVMYGVLIRPLRWPHADRLIVLNETRGGRPPRFGTFSSAVYLAWREGSTTIEAIAAWSQQAVTLTGAGDPERIRVIAASPSLFPTLGVQPLIGSLFDQEDETSPVLVLSESLWRERFGAAPDILGRFVQLDGQPHTIIGVLPDALSYPDRQARGWVPLRIRATPGNDLSMFNAIALLRPGATAAQAASEGTARGRLAADTGLTTLAIFGSKGPVEVSAIPLREAQVAEVRRPLLVLIVAAGLLLFTAIVNIANLQLVRATKRSREIAIRAALGASGARLTRQLLIESLLLGLTGGGAGLILAVLLDRLLPTVLPPDFPRIEDLRIDEHVLFFAFVASLLASVAFGLIPAARSFRRDVVEPLRQSKTIGTRSGLGLARTLVMAGQVAISCVLLVGASLLGRTFVALVSADRGYDPTGVLTARVSMPESLYSPERRYTLLGQILERLTQVPETTDAAFTSELPLTRGGSTAAFRLRSAAADGGTVSVQASPRIVSPRYFSVMGMRIVEGRSFTASDTHSSQPVVVVNRAFARQYLWHLPLGAKLPMGVGYQTDDEEATVVGVVDDVRYPMAADPSSHPEMYFSYQQMNGRIAVPVVTFVVRTAGHVAAPTAALRMAVREADQSLVPEAVMMLEDRISLSLARPRLYAGLLGGFAAVALMIAAVGLFGVLSYTVSQRSRELAVRAALGAQQIDIVRLVLRHGLLVTGSGIAVGLLSSLALMRSISALLYGIVPFDGITYFVVPIILLAVAAAACFGPARRAARIDPLVALRYE